MKCECYGLRKKGTCVTPGLLFLLSPGGGVPAVVLLAAGGDPGFGHDIADLLCDVGMLRGEVVLLSDVLAQVVKFDGPGLFVAPVVQREEDNHPLVDPQLL